MKDVYEKNPQMGDPASLASQINQTSQNIERLRGELSKYEVTLTPPPPPPSSGRHRDPGTLQTFGRTKIHLGFSPFHLLVCVELFLHGL